jgi:hypothetical protein
MSRPVVSGKPSHSGDHKKEISYVWLYPSDDHKKRNQNIEDQNIDQYKIDILREDLIKIKDMKDKFQSLQKMENNTANEFLNETKDIQEFKCIGDYSVDHETCNITKRDFFYIQEKINNYKENKQKYEDVLNNYDFRRNSRFNPLSPTYTVTKKETQAGGKKTKKRRTIKKKSRKNKLRKSKVNKKCK